MEKQVTAYILGAGFSANAGLPLQADFTKLFFKAEAFKRGKSRPLMADLRAFVVDTFGFDKRKDPSLFPELEDVFTMLDLSANTGHHLGHMYSPRRLRKLRRYFLSRTIRMLYQAYLAGRDNPSDNREGLLNFLDQIAPQKHQFVSLNWDTVLEGGLEEVGKNFLPRYSPEIEIVDIEDNKIKSKPRDRKTEELLLAKVHGSINWLYCDCCRRCFSVPPKKVSLLASQVLKKEEVKRLYKEKKQVRLNCPMCDVDLSVRLATFSYQKALKTLPFESSWLQAEKTLREARKWVFIGYSMPAADFEFKYLLKRVALARKKKPEIFVVTKSKKKTDDVTLMRYTRLFGETHPHFLADGFTKNTINQIL